MYPCRRNFCSVIPLYYEKSVGLSRRLLLLYLLRTSHFLRHAHCHACLPCSARNTSRHPYFFGDSPRRAAMLQLSSPMTSVRPASLFSIRTSRNQLSTMGKPKSLIKPNTSEMSILNVNSLLILFRSCCTRFNHLRNNMVQFQTVTICNGFISFIFKSLFHNTPINLRIWTIRQHTNNIDDRKIPFFLLFVPSGSNRLIIKQLQVFNIGYYGFSYANTLIQASTILPTSAKSLESIYSIELLFVFILPHSPQKVKKKMIR